MLQLSVRFSFEDLDEMGLREVAEEWHEAGVDGFRVLACEGVRGTVWMRTEGPLDLSRYDEVDPVEGIESVGDDGEFEYLVTLTTPEVWSVPECPRGMICEGDVAVTDDGVALTLVASRSVVEDVNGRIATHDVEPEILGIGPYTGREDGLDALTDRQREVLFVAYERGYFEVPRQVTTEELAESLDLERSTVAEHLRNAESTLLSEVLGG